MILLTFQTVFYVVIYHHTAQKMKFFIKDFFSKCDQIGFGQRSAGGGKTNIKLDNLVKTFQMHCRSKPCGKYKNMTCRLKFGPFFTEKKP